MERVPAHYAPLPPSHAGHTALAAPALWDAFVALVPGGADPAALTLALEPRFHAHADAKHPRALVVRAKQASKRDLAAAGEDLDGHTLLVPPALAAAHPLVFPRRAPSSPTSASPALLLVSLTTPIPLTSVVLVALDAHSCAHAAHPATGHSLEARLADADGADLVREGATLCLTGQGAADRYRVAMAEPVLQGVVVRGQTQVLVLPPQGDDAAAGGDGVTLPNGTSEHGDATEDDEEEEEEELLLDFDLDENFLANSVLSPLRAANTPLTSPLPDHKLANVSSFPLSALAPAPAARAGSVVSAVPLAHPVPSELLVPAPDADEDDVPRAYVATAELGRLGLFSGDWAVLGPEEGEGEKGRLARVFAADGLVAAAEPSPSAAPVVHLPPALLFNLLGPSALSSTPAAPATLHLLPASRVSPILPAPFPTAASVTIARLASPHSVNKVFQPLFLEGLKEHFSRRRRAVKKGDVIAVGIDEERVRFAGEGKEGAQEDEVDLPAAPTTPTAVVYFLITSLSTEPATTSTAATGDFELDRQLEDGALGCIVDPKVTKLLQTGVERGLVPDVGGWLGVPPSPRVPLTPDTFGTPTPGSRLLAFLRASLAPRASTYALPLTVLLAGARGSGKRVLVRGVSRAAGVGVLEVDCFDLLGESEAKTEGRLRAMAVEKALACAPVVLLLRNVEALARKSQAMETGQEPPMTTVLRDCFASIRDGWKASGHPVVVVATTTDVDKVPTGVLGLFKEEIGIEAPGEPERLAILRALTAADLLAPDVSLRSLAVQTAALVANDLVDLVRRSRAAAAERVLSLPSSTSSSSPPSLVDLAHAGVALTAADFSAALDKARAAYSESIGAPKIPSVTWDDVGGLASVKSDILDTIQLPLERPELFRDGLKKRSGILLYGPPGTGKTLLAKAVATSCSLNFFSVKGPELLNMYIGESEANVRRVFQRARDAKPCVIFFDELDSVAPKRGNQGDSGGVMDRIVSQLLAELDGMSEGKGGSDVFVIGATNRPDLLDPALLRPGRFDRMLYLGVSDNHAAQLNILHALTRKFKLAPETDLARLAAKCPFNYTGADFYALCSDAMLKAMTRKATEVDTRIAELNAQPPYSTGASPPLTPQYYLAELATPQEIEVLVAQEDFEAALAELVPSVSQAEMLHYKTVQSRFSAETLNSDDKLAAKEAEANAAAATAAGSVAHAAVEQPRPNGIVVNGAAAEEDSEEADEEARERRRRAKGKGKARADN
ncbi:peroxisomal assembly protein [Rhodotorula kratochvilovae]